MLPDWEPVVPLVLSAVACVFAFRAWWLMSVTTKAVLKGIDNFLTQMNLMNEEDKELSERLS